MLINLITGSATDANVGDYVRSKERPARFRSARCAWRSSNDSPGYLSSARRADLHLRVRQGGQRNGPGGLCSCGGGSDGGADAAAGGCTGGKTCPTAIASD